jgi:phage tail-like protein
MTKMGSKSESSALVISHVTDFYRRYPGEMVKFYTCVDVQQPLTGLTVRITLPRGLVPGASRALAGPHASAGNDGALVEVAPDVGTSHFVWQAEGKLPAGTRCEYQLEARVAPTERDVILESRAVATCEGVQGEEAEEIVAIAVSAQGRYLDYLPAFYREDELMGRFLMLFESFWAPIEGQIDHLPFYFDPQMTPSDFLPWLASWLDLALDEHWPEERRRQLIGSAASLYRKRGTKRGLQEYLEIYAGGKVQIIEHRANNLRLDPEAKLGSGIALGMDNVPHSFTVILRLPPISSPGRKREKERQELERRRRIEAIIEAEKPAHTSYNLQLEIDPALGTYETR